MNTTGSITDEARTLEKRPRVAIIAALARNRVIGRDNTMPWHLPEDLRHFKALTTGAPVIMGRRTQASIGRPLPGRDNIVISRHPPVAAGCRHAGSLVEALALAGDAPVAWVIGGAQIYTLALPLADRLHLTEIDTDLEGDTWFPAFDRSQWREVSRSTHRSTGDPSLGFAFVDYERASSSTT